MVAPAEEVEVVYFVSQPHHPVLAGGLVDLHAGHAQREHAGLAVLQLGREIVVESEIHAQQRRESLIDAHLRNVVHGAGNGIARGRIGDEAQAVHILLIGAVTAVRPYGEHALVGVGDIDALEHVTEPR